MAADMHYVAVISLLLCCISCQLPSTHSPANREARTNHGEIVPLGLSDFEGALYFFETRGSVLLAAPRWKSGAEFPPLSPRKAIAAATREVERIRPDVAEWYMDGVGLEQVGESEDECWIYRVRFSRADVPHAGLPPWLDIPVLMDGTAVRGMKNQR